MANQRGPLQLINTEMTMDKAGLESFQTVLGRDGEGARYGVVSILGPQNGGKSTLLNFLFGTYFEVMDAAKDSWASTTKGIFLAKSKEILIMDVEGSDSEERQGQINFERKFAAFSFAMSHTVLVNIKNDSIGLDSGGCKSLLKSALEFMVCFLGHQKITLIIVVRDKHPDTPVVTIEKKVKRSIDQIWRNIRKPEAFQYKELGDCLNVKVDVMHSYVHQKDIFVKEVSKLFDVIVSSQGTEKYSARQFATKAQEKWQIINNHLELNIQSYKELIDNERCYKLAWEYIGSFEEELNKMLKRQPTEFSGHEVEERIHHSLEEYNKATKSFTASATLKGQEILKSELPKKWKIAFDQRKIELHREILRSFGVVLKTRLNSDTCSDAKTIVDGCITESLKEYRKRCRGMMAEHAPWDTIDVDNLLWGQLEEKSADVFYSVKQEMTLGLIKNTVITTCVAGAAAVDAAVAGGAATLATAALVTATAVSGGATALAAGVAAATSTPIVGAGKRMYNEIKFFCKNGNYRPEKPSASDNLEKPSASANLEKP